MDEFAQGEGYRMRSDKVVSMRSSTTEGLIKWDKMNQ